jgi:DNA excision repair protein ERCC-3
VQQDRTVLLEVQHPEYEPARDRLQRFAELEKSPEFVHFYRITPISVWNAAALGEDLEELLDWLVRSSRFPVAPQVVQQVREWYRRWGMLRLLAHGDRLLLECDDGEVLHKLCQNVLLAPLVEFERGRCTVAADDRGALKQVLVRLGYPVDDRAGYRRGSKLAFDFRERTAGGRPFALRAYQKNAASAFWASGSDSGGCGVIVLPCGAGKTVVAIAAMQLCQAHTLVLTTNTVAVRQWIRELLDKTSLQPDQVGEYTGDLKEIRPVTVATYQILTWRRQKLETFEHLQLFDQGDWGLIVYDEVHLLPAPVFRATAGIQARRRLGLTATLVREDGRQDEVFSLIGPKRCEVPWKQLERQGYLAAARCYEVRVPLGEARAHRYLSSGARAQFRVASENEHKLDAVGELLRQHAEDRVLVIGQFLEQVRQIATVFSLPLITGATPTAEREQLYAAFRRGDHKRLVVSKVGNFAVDLPDANVAIQVSGTFGSRQEEAQRLGRILRPKSDGSSALFYSLVSDSTREQEFAQKRQLFLTEQGYGYAIVSMAELQGPGRREARA